MTVVGFFVMLLTTIAGVWWRIEGRISTARDRADAVNADLAEYKLHICETYITKQRLRETKEEIMDAITGVHAAVERMTVRVDRIVENQARPRTTRSA